LAASTIVFNRFISFEADVCEKFAKNDLRSKVFVHYDSMLAVPSYSCMMCQRLFSKWSIGIAHLKRSFSVVLFLRKSAIILNFDFTS